MENIVKTLHAFVDNNEVSPYQYRMRLIVFILYLSEKLIPICINCSWFSQETVLSVTRNDGYIINQDRSFTAGPIAAQNVSF